MVRRKLRSLRELLFHSPVRGNRMGTALVVTTLAMVTFGTFMVASSSEGLAVASGSNFALMKAQAIYVGIGLLAMFVMGCIHVRRLVQWAPLLVALGALALVVVVIFGHTANGGQRWINLGFFQFQPSEIFKVATVFFVAFVVSRYHRIIGEWQHLALYMVPIGLGLILILFERDIGTSSIVGLMAISMLVVAGISALQMTVASLLAVTVVGLYIQHSKYARARFAFLHPNTQLAGNNYQLFHSKIALGSGGWTGLGYGHSRMKWGMLPNPHTDFIFSIIGEELGLVGILFVLGLFVTFLIFATRIIKACKNDELRLVAIGLTTWIALEALVNIASVVGVWPVTGVPLPFFSYGGTALIAQLAAVGLLYNIAHDQTTSHHLIIRKEAGPFVPMSTVKALVHRRVVVVPSTRPRPRSHRP